ncbi:MAG: hypothetical protein ACXWJD_10640 [Burkholderiaceae bacterium]
MIGMSNACADRGRDRDERATQREEQRMQRQDQYGRGQYEQRGRAPEAAPDAPRHKSNMTPEERRALRQQIHDAGREVYPPGR